MDAVPSAGNILRSRLLHQTMSPVNARESGFVEKF